MNASLNPNGTNLKISRILHAGYVFECGSTQIAFDPIFENPFSRNCHAFPPIEFDLDKVRGLKFDAVFISHFHDDHCSLESLNLLDRATPIYMYCLFEELFSWIKELGFTQVYPLTLDEPINIGDFEVIPRRALDEHVDSLFQIKAAGLNVLNVVDSWIDYATLDQLARFSWDMILWPFQTMREIEVIAPGLQEPAPAELPAEWIEQLKKLSPRYVVPSSCQFKQESWSWYNNAFFPITYKQFQKEIEAALPEARVVRLNPSVSVILDQQSLRDSPPLEWIRPIGDQDVDYEYLPRIKPPPTSEIAQKFSALTNAQTENVHEFCRVGLLEKYQSMEAPEEPFFRQPRLWHLAIYDHTGAAVDYWYSLKGHNIKLISAGKEPADWSTEVSIAKLYAALELGESLTSMYIRINAVDSVEIVEDPLIRCLFNGDFGAYQKAQLKKLKSQEL